MPLPLLLILTCVFLGFAIASALVQKVVGYLGGIALLAVACAGGWWAYTSLSMPLQIQSTTRHPIQTVTYPDGSKQQMFTVNGSHYNANAKWNRVIDEKEYEVEVVVPVTIYFGVTYDGLSPTFEKQYNLVKKAVK